MTSKYTQPASTFGLLPVYHWRGPQPPQLSLPADHQGWLVCLCLRREEEACFVPLAWDQTQQTQDDTRNQYTPLPALTPAAHSRLQHDISQTIHSLKQSGWRVHGRFTIHFTGRDATTDFSRETEAYLWQQPFTQEEADKNNQP